MKQSLKIIILILSLNIISYSQTLIYPALPADKITDMHFISESEIILINNGGSIYKSYDGGNNWKLIKHYQGETLLSINFINRATGFILPAKPANFAAPSLKYTNDMGETWNEQNLDISSVNDFIPLSENVSLKATWDGQIQRLDNFFNSWDTVFTMPTYTISDPEFGEYKVPFGNILKFQKLSSNGVIALCSNESAFEYGIIKDSLSFLLKSLDIGISWDTLWIGSNKVINDFIFINEQIGWMSNSQNIYKTVDGGINWSELLPNNSVVKINNLFSQSENILYFSSNNNHKLFKITEPNSTIETLDFGQDISGINLFSENYGFLFGAGIDKYTGINSELNSIHKPINDVVDDLVFIGNSIGFIAGYDGVYKTEDGGVTWTQKLKTQNSNSGELAVSNNETCWYVKFDSIYKSLDLGESWETIELSTKSQIYGGINFYDNNLGILYSVAEENTPGSQIYSTKYNYITTDGGLNWNPVLNDPIFKDIDFQKVKFTDPEHLFVIGRNGLWVSTDTSKTWKNLYNTDYFYTGYSFDFYDSLFGVLSFGYSESLITIDGGKTWKKYDKPIGTNTNDVAIIGPNYGNEYIRAIEVGNNGTAIKYYFNHAGEKVLSKQLTTFTKSNLTKIAIFEESQFPNVWIGSENFNILYREYEKLPTNVEENNSPTIPIIFTLSQNYPNPFNPTTTIEYTIPLNEKRETLPTGRQAKNVKIIVYDVLGKKVVTLVNEIQSPGKHQIVFDASNLSSGIYYYSLSFNNQVTSKKMILLK